MTAVVVVVRDTPPTNRPKATFIVADADQAATRARCLWFQGGAVAEDSRLVQWLLSCARLPPRLLCCIAITVVLDGEHTIP